MSNAAHRLLWTVLALALVAVGGAALAVGLGWLPGGGAPLLAAGAATWWRAGTPWSPLAVAVGGVLVTLLGQQLLVAGLRVPGQLAGTLAHPGDGRGRTRVASEVLTAALERDLCRAPGVRRARVVLTGAIGRPDVWVEVCLDPDAGLDAARAHVDAAVRRFAATIGCQPAHLDVTALVAESPR
ncbi:alkaline shock response membrane anchor protein AmaP [Micromonospora sp. DR5-3]|uniref:hypothetical protein n=1 Tax=unclassified Micromonospora TaxID=2617518 RepID=UPI0011DC6372|nr:MULTISPECIES: hypothetical protein [unclassified Micromonospora]MCW3815169.1 alkaline shock response membrane anchor protein AmaP [Micromonospora sp. DR5-3]TYC22208.1 hypothetical protein FXF52_21650 [Micromonospora sp. MP36]